MIQVESIRFAEDSPTLQGTYDYLEHYGILGMKWGVRRYQNKDGSLTRAGKKRYLNKDGSYNETAKKEIPLYAMSNKELQDLVTRLNLEQQYSRLTTPEKKKSEAADKAVKFIVDALDKIGRVSLDLAIKAVSKMADERMKAEDEAKQPKKKEKLSDFSEDEKNNPDKLSLKDLNTLNALNAAIKKAKEERPKEPEKPKEKYESLRMKTSDFNKNDFGK